LKARTLTLKKITIVTSAYNEEGCIEEFCNSLLKLSESYKKEYAWEFIIVDNGSSDKTFDKVSSIYKKDHRFKIIKLTRNFNFFGGLSCGLKHATGDAAVVMCADLEDPPATIPLFIEKWEQGYKNVYGIIQERQGSWLRRLNAKIFYWIIHNFSGRMIPKNVAEFRLIDREVYQVINNMPEFNRFLRGLFSWTGFKSIGVPFNRGKRLVGRSKASTLVVLLIALQSILSFSHLPIRVASLLGIFISLFSFLALGFFFVSFLIFPGPFKGFATILCLFLLMFGLLFIILGIIGEYIGLIFDDVKKRPIYIIEQKIGFDDEC